jgi:RND superfamily putative drug exporter
MSMLGDRAWWLPKRLARVLPDLDIEGEKLNRRLEQDRAVTAPSATMTR